jgi:hypothetical protein
MPISKNSSYDEVLKELKIDGNQLEFASEEFRNNYDLCALAISQNFAAIRFCSERLKANKEIALLAIRKSAYRSNEISGSEIFNNIISETLKDDLEFVFEAFIVNSSVFPPEYLLNDFYFMYQVVKRNGRLISFGGREIRQDRQIVLTAAKQCGDFLCDSMHYELFWNDREIALAAAASSRSPIPCIFRNFSDDTEFINLIISNAYNYSKLNQIPKEKLLSINGVLNTERFFDCYFSIKQVDNRLKLLLDILETDFLTKELFEKIKIESIKRNVEFNVINTYFKLKKINLI